MAGNAAKMAAENLKEKIIDAVSKVNQINKEEIYLKNGRVFSNDRQLDISWYDAAEIVTRNSGALAVSGYYNSPKLGGNFKGSGAGLSPSYSFGAVIAEVDVDLNTGEVKVVNMWGAHDCGRAINPLAVEGQLEGSWHMGMGQALSEELRYYNGLLLNGNLLDYKVPTSLDTPDFNTAIIESIDPEGPFGAKECGEGALHPSIPAIANAVYNATGVRITSLPIRSEDILTGISKRKLTDKLSESVIE
jgi:CO/xanthine dehydrogenase Mo-binding subunit